MTKRIFLLAGIFLCAAWGGIQVVDGDSLRGRDERIRLNGMDAPEYDQPCWDGQGIQYECGTEATNFLKGLVEGKKIRCDYLRKDIYNRHIAVCYAGGINLNREMELQGWAVSYDFNSEGYPEEEKQAKEAGRGIWRGKFMRPELWRRLTKD